MLKTPMISSKAAMISSGIILLSDIDAILATAPEAANPNATLNFTSLTLFVRLIPVPRMTVVKDKTVASLSGESSSSWNNGIAMTAPPAPVIPISRPTIKPILVNSKKRTLTNVRDYNIVIM